MRQSADMLKKNNGPIVFMFPEIHQRASNPRSQPKVTAKKQKEYSPNKN